MVKPVVVLVALVTALSGIALGVASMRTGGRPVGAVGGSNESGGGMPGMAVALTGGDANWVGYDITEILTPAGRSGEYPLEQFSAALYFYPYPPGFGRDRTPTEIGDGIKVAEINPLTDGSRDGVLSFGDGNRDGMLSFGDRFVMSDAREAMCDESSLPCEPTWDSYVLVISYMGRPFEFAVVPVVLTAPQAYSASR